MEGWIKQAFGSLKLYWQHVCVAILVTLWIIFVAPKAKLFAEIMSAWQGLATVLIVIALGYSIARLVETRQKNGNGNGTP